MLAKLAIGVATGSLGLLSDAAHSSLDLIASILALLAVRAAQKPADHNHPYGHGRAENLAAYTTGLLLLLAAAAIAYEAVQRLRAPGTSTIVVGPLSLAFLGGAIVLEVGRSMFLRWLGRTSGSPSIRALATDKIADLLSVTSVLLGLLAVRLGVASADSIAALVVAGLITWAAVRLVRGSGDILMDRVAAAANRAVIEATAQVPGVREVRSARVRQVGAELMGEVEVAGRPTLSLEAVQGLTERIERAVRARVPNLELTVVVRSGEDPNQLVERVHATAARNGNFRDLHDVIVEREADESLHLSLHAKLPGTLSMREAARLAAGFERDLAAAIPEVSRIDIHLEPLEPDVVHGRNVTADNEELVARVKRLVERHPKVAACQDIELSSRFGHITAHVTARVADDLSLDQAHAIATELEDLIHHAEPAIDRAVVRAIA